MKRLAITMTMIATFAASSAALADPPWARYHDGYVAYARVTSVRPITRPVYESRRECRAYPVGEREVSYPHRGAGTVLGAVIGGLLGNTIGKGDGRRAATVAGAVIGGAIGNQAGARDRDVRTQTVYQRRCDVRTVRAGRRVVGYDVAYRYRGQRFYSRMDHDPGRRVRIRVDDDVRLAE